MSKQAMELALEFIKTYCATSIPALKTVSALKEAIKQYGEPVAYQFQDREGNWCNFNGPKHYEATVVDGTWPIRPLYTSAPTEQCEVSPIPEGWQLVPKEPTFEMIHEGQMSRLCPVTGSESTASIFKAMLSAAPEYKEKQQ